MDKLPGGLGGMFGGDRPRRRLLTGNLDDIDP